MIDLDYWNVDLLTDLSALIQPLSSQAKMSELYSCHREMRYAACLDHE